MSPPAAGGGSLSWASLSALAAPWRPRHTLHSQFSFHQIMNKMTSQSLTHFTPHATSYWWPWIIFLCICVPDLPGPQLNWALKANKWPAVNIFYVVVSFVGIVRFSRFILCMWWLLEHNNTKSAPQFTLKVDLHSITAVKISTNDNWGRWPSCCLFLIDHFNLCHMQAQ